MFTRQNYDSFGHVWIDQKLKDSYYSLWSFDRGEANYTVDPPLWKLDPSYSRDTAPIWPLIIIGIVAFLVWTEYGSQDCRHQNCNNRAEQIYPEDSITDAISKISTNLMRNHTLVNWRRSLLIAIVIGLIILFIFCPKFPDGFTVLVTIFLVFFVVHLATAWFSSHWWKMIDYKTDHYLQELRNRIIAKD